MIRKEVPEKPIIDVVAAIIQNEEAEILCALRSVDMSLPGLWEFPGGKVDTGESYLTALKREIHEELLCEIEIDGLFDDHTHEYDNIAVRLISYKCVISAGEPKAVEHAKLVWLKRPYLKSLVWAPADISTLDKLITE